MRQGALQKKPGCRSTFEKMVPGAGFEPARAKTHYPLKIACLPVPPARLYREAIIASKGDIVNLYE